MRSTWPRSAQRCSRPRRRRSEARRQALIDQGRQKEEAACLDDTSGAVLSSRKGEPCAGASSVAATGTSSSVVLGLVLGLGLGVPLCLLCVGMLIFCGRRRKREAPAAPQIVLPPAGEGEDHGRASIGRAYYERRGVTMAEAATNQL